MTGPNHFEPGLFDPTREVDRTERRLPHWFQPGTMTFVTFRTADSMPRSVVEAQRHALAEWLKHHGVAEEALTGQSLADVLPNAKLNEFRRLRDRAWHGALDECHGACVLRRPELATIVGDALRYFDGQRYLLDCFVVMPNHVHLLVQFRPSTSLSRQSPSWLRYTAREINLCLNQNGKFWQAEPFDHLVRSQEQFEYLRKYIRDNPSKANLKRGEYLYWSRAAGGLGS